MCVVVLKGEKNLSFVQWCVCVCVLVAITIKKNKGKLYFLGGEYIYFYFSYILFYFSIIFFPQQQKRRRKNLSSTENILRARTAAAAVERGWYCVFVERMEKIMGMSYKKPLNSVCTLWNRIAARILFFSHIFPLFLYFRGGSRVGGVRKYSCCCCCFALCLKKPVSVWIREKKYIYL